MISAADRIIAANNEKSGEELFNEERDPEVIKKILGISEQNPALSYDLYYKNIVAFLNGHLPKNNPISKVIRSLINVMLSHKELSGITYGVRGADSRMATSADMENMIDVLSEWSSTPTDYYRLTTILFDKCKELKYIPENRELSEYMQ